MPQYPLSSVVMIYQVVYTVNLVRSTDCVQAAARKHNGPARLQRLNSNPKLPSLVLLSGSDGGHESTGSRLYRDIPGPHRSNIHLQRVPVIANFPDS